MAKKIKSSWVGIFWLKFFFAGLAQHYFSGGGGLLSGWEVGWMDPWGSGPLRLQKTHDPGGSKNALVNLIQGKQARERGAEKNRIQKCNITNVQKREI